LPCAMLALFAAHLWSPEGDCRTLLEAFALNSFLAVPIYVLLPVCGPVFVFAGFPWSPPPVDMHVIAVAAAPNGMPSVHMSTALLILIYAWRWPAGRPLGLIFLVLIILGTLGSGQHYLFDLLCAIPYTIVVYRISYHQPKVNAPPAGAEMMTLNA
jgi:hypothetical protein